MFTLHVGYNKQFLPTRNCTRKRCDSNKIIRNVQSLHHFGVHTCRSFHAVLNPSEVLTFVYCTRRSLARDITLSLRLLQMTLPTKMNNT